jgi:hypothetical protein
MIARLSILLPFTLHMRDLEAMQPHEVDQGLYRVRIHPPRKAKVSYLDAEALSPMPLHDVLDQLQPETPQTATDIVLVDEAPTVQANLLQVDFLKDMFERPLFKPDAEPVGHSEGDPPADLGFKIANNCLQRIRTYLVGLEIVVLSPATSFWTLEYLTDDGQPLQSDGVYVRRIRGAPISWRITAIDGPTWSELTQLPFDHEPHGWDLLLLDARDALPDINESVALANAALEGFSIWLLDRIVESRGMPPGLWKWINKRDHWMKQPSVADRFDDLLLIFAGKSMRVEQPRLWRGFSDLRYARNSFSHGGRATIKKSKRKRTDEIPVTEENARELIGLAFEIVDWCELLVPARLRRQIRREPKLHFRVKKVFSTGSEKLAQAVSQIAVEAPASEIVSLNTLMMVPPDVPPLTEGGPDL